MRVEDFASPRISALRRDIESGNLWALRAFWQEVDKQGTPLIEAIQEEDEVLVTFLWRGDRETKNVVILGGIAGWHVIQNQMARLLQTNLWYKTYHVPSDTRMSYWLSPNDSLIPLNEVEDWKERVSTWQPDPLNLHLHSFEKDAYQSDKMMGISIVELPNAPSQPWILSRANVPSGYVQCYQLESSILENERNVWIYTPPGYTCNNQPYGLLILFDGLTYIHQIPTFTILDNLLADKAIPPLIAVLIDSIGPSTREHELSCYPPFLEFLRKELVPWIRQHYQVTMNPRQTVIGGSSCGGLCAAYVGFNAPEMFGNVLSQSGAFMVKPENKNVDEYLAHQFSSMPTLPLRFHMDVGLFECETGINGEPSFLAANRYMHDILHKQGYPIHYIEYSGSHDYLCWRGTLAEGLIALIGNTSLSLDSKQERLASTERN